MHVIHRGIVNKNYRENTLHSFKKSFNVGFGIETDIHLTKDNKFICFHDFTLNRIFKKNLSVKNLDYSYIKKISTLKKKPVPLLSEILKASKNKFLILIEIKPYFSNKVLKKLIKDTSKHKKCIFISFKHKNIYNLLKIKSNIKAGLSFSNRSSIKTIIKKSKNQKINFCILDKVFLDSKSIQKLKVKKYFYTIKKKSEFKKYCKNNHLIFENL